jgi:hypothetical protein
VKRFRNARDAKVRRRISSSGPLLLVCGRINVSPSGPAAAALLWQSSPVCCEVVRTGGGGKMHRVSLRHEGHGDGEFSLFAFIPIFTLFLL